MNLLLRLLYVLYLSRSRERLPLERAVSRLTLRVLPNDLDINMHMNNGRYLTICDLNRVDLFIRTGLLKSMRKRKWFPVIAEHTMAYKKSLHLFEKYDVTLEVTHWDEKYFHMTSTGLTTSLRVRMTPLEVPIASTRSALLKVCVM